MNNTAVSAEKKKVLFISDAHENFYNEKLNMVKRKDCYHKALIYCLGMNAETRSNITEIYDFDTDCVKTECLSSSWQTSGSEKVVRMAFNLYCNGIPSISDYNTSDEQLEECRKYTVEELFCCEYAPFFWMAIQIRYPEFASYNFKLKELFGGDD